MEQRTKIVLCELFEFLIEYGRILSDAADRCQGTLV
jgi:hypothetical protein